MKKLGLFLIMLLIGHAPQAAEDDVLFVCTVDEQKKIQLLGVERGSVKEVRLDSCVDRIGSSDWVPVDDVNGALYSATFSRGYDAVLIIDNIEGCRYEFRDALTANRIGDTPSHNVTKTLTVTCNGKSFRAQLPCSDDDDGLKDASRYFPVRDLFELEEEGSGL